MSVLRVQTQRDDVESRPVPLPHLLLTTSAQTLYTVPTNRALKVRGLSVANTSGSAATLTLYGVPSGGSPATGNTELAAVSIPANTSADLTMYIGGLYTAGMTLEALAGTTDVLVLHGWGELVL